jgi:hypothetical protein
MGPSQRQEAVKALQQSGLSQREACKIMQARRRSPNESAGIRSTQDAPLIKRLTQLAQDRPRYGCKRLYGLYERMADEGDPYMNYKRFRRLYRLANLQISRRRRRSRAKYVRGRLKLARFSGLSEIGHYATVPVRRSKFAGERYPRAECRRCGLYQPSMNSKTAILASR